MRRRPQSRPRLINALRRPSPPRASAPPRCTYRGPRCPGIAHGDARLGGLHASVPRAGDRRSRRVIARRRTPRASASAPRGRDRRRLVAHIEGGDRRTGGGGERAGARRKREARRRRRRRRLCRGLTSPPCCATSSRVTAWPTGPGGGRSGRERRRNTRSDAHPPPPPHPLRNSSTPATKHPGGVGRDEREEGARNCGLSCAATFVKVEHLQPRHGWRSDSGADKPRGFGRLKHRPSQFGWTECVARFKDRARSICCVPPASTIQGKM